MPPSANWFEIRNAASESGPAEILIYGRIGKTYYDNSSVGAKDFADGLSKLPQDREILVRINSPGGNVWDGLAIYHQLQSRRSHVTMQVDGLAASIASIIAMAGRETRVPKNALVMIHDPSALAFGTSAEMRKMADTLDTHKRVLVGIYHAKSGKPVAEIEAAMSSETWYSGDKAKEFGLADTVTDQVTITAAFDLTHFRNVPDALKASPSASEAAPPIDCAPPPESTNEISNHMKEATVTAAPAAAAAAAAAPAADTETPLSLLQRVMNLLKPKDASDELRTEITNLKDEIKNLKASQEAGETEVEKRSKVLAQQTLAKAGHTAVNAEDPDKEKTADKTSAELWVEYKAINQAKGARAAREFYVANKAKM